MSSMPLGNPVPSEPPGGRFFHLPLYAFVGLLCVWIAYSSTVMSMYEQWISSASYSHGVVVVPVTLYFIWMRRRTLLDASFAPSLMGLSALLVSGLMWVLGELAGVVTVAQVALVCITISFVWAALGSDFTRRIIYPLGFLFLAIPFSDGVLPYLMKWTADATVAALRFSGVAVYQDGFNFIIPSGRWSVVEACAGSRYLVSSLFAGALYAYMTYTHVYKRAVFLVLALVVPLFANWLRAYTIVMVAHLTNNEWGLGVSHITLGWIIFGAVILIMFWIGMRWQDVEPGPATLNPISAQGPTARQKVGLGVALALAVAWQGVALWRAPADEAGPTSVMPSLQAGTGWTAVAAMADVRSEAIGERRRLEAAFSDGDESVQVFVHLFSEQRQGREMINRYNKVELPEPLPSRSIHSVNMALGGGDVPFMRDERASIDSRDGFAVYRSYNVRGHWTASEYMAKALQAWARLTGGRDDSVMLVVVTPTDGDATRDTLRLARFLASHGGAIGDVVLQATLPSAGSAP
jgi:exosortase A